MLRLNISVTRLFFLVILNTTSTTHSFQRIKKTISHPYSILSTGIVSLSIYSFLNKAECIKSYGLLKNNWHSIPGIIKYPSLCAIGWLVYYTHYKNKQQQLLNIDAKNKAQNSLLAKIAEFEKILGSFALRVSNIELILNIDNKCVENSEQSKPSRIAEQAKKIIKIKKKVNKLRETMDLIIGSENSVSLYTQLKGMEMNYINLNQKIETFNKILKNQVATQKKLFAEKK